MQRFRTINSVEAKSCSTTSRISQSKGTNVGKLDRVACNILALRSTRSDICDCGEFVSSAISFRSAEYWSPFLPSVLSEQHGLRPKTNQTSMEAVGKRVNRWRKKGIKRVKEVRIFRISHRATRNPLSTAVQRLSMFVSMKDEFSLDEIGESRRNFRSASLSDQGNSLAMEQRIVPAELHWSDSPNRISKSYIRRGRQNLGSWNSRKSFKPATHFLPRGKRMIIARAR